jgi:putative endonuclease
MSFITYIVECADSTYYTGWTDDIDARLRKHNERKGARYTRSRVPVRLAISWQFLSKSDAMRAEWFLKKLSRQEKSMLITGIKSLDQVLPADRFEQPFTTLLSQH